jgi:hypothetical protein
MKHGGATVCRHRKAGLCLNEGFDTRYRHRFFIAAVHFAGWVSPLVGNTKNGVAYFKDAI